MDSLSAAIAAGVGIGMVVAFTPTIGFQTVLLAALLDGNRPVFIDLGLDTSSP